MRNFLSSTFQKEAFQRRKLLWSIIIGVILFHVLVVVVFGSMIMFRHIFKREVAFVAPPQIQKRLEPRKLEHKVKIKQQQQKSGRPRIQPRLSANRITDFALPEVKNNPEAVKDPIKSSLKSFGAAGLGTGTAGGQGGGGLGLGVSEVMVFGFKSKTERVAILVDVSPSMIEDERGGFAGFKALKREIRDVIRSLNEGSFFNLIMFDGKVDIFSPDAVIANRVNKKEAEDWMVPYMTAEGTTANKIGTLSGSYKIKPETPVLPARGGLTRTELAIAAAMESGVDTMFIITDGVHHIMRPMTPELEKQREEIVKKRLKDPSNKRILEKEAKLREAFDEKIRKETENRAKRGLPPRVVEGGRNPPGRGLPSPGIYDDGAVLDYINELGKALYKDKGKKTPRIYVIGYVTTSTTDRFLKLLATRNSGSFKRSRTLVKPIKSD